MDAQEGIARGPTVLCFGDSLTAGYYEDGAKFHPYSRVVQCLLSDPTHPCTVDHVGLSGWTTTQMVNSLDNSACVDVCRRKWKGLRAKLGERPYSHCFILAGTNDVSRNSADKIFDSLLTLAKTASTCGCKTFVMTVPELAVEENVPCIAATRRDLNKLILNADGSPLTRGQTLSAIDLAPLLPMRSAAQADRELIWEPDGLHLRPAGYNIIAKTVAEHVSASLPRAAATPTSSATLRHTSAPGTSIAPPPSIAYSSKTRLSLVQTSVMGGCKGLEACKTVMQAQAQSGSLFAAKGGFSETYRSPTTSEARHTRPSTSRQIFKRISVTCPRTMDAPIPARAGQHEVGKVSGRVHARALPTEEQLLLHILLHHEKQKTCKPSTHDASIRACGSDKLSPPFQSAGSPPNMTESRVTYTGGSASEYMATCVAAVRARHVRPASAPRYLVATIDSKHLKAEEQPKRVVSSVTGTLHKRRELASYGTRHATLSTHRRNDARGFNSKELPKRSIVLKCR